MPASFYSAAVKWTCERPQHITTLRVHHGLSLDIFLKGEWTIQTLSYPFRMEAKSQNLVIDLYKSAILGLPSPTVTGPSGLGMKDTVQRVGSAYEYISQKKETPDVLLLILRQGAAQYEIVDGHHRITAAHSFSNKHSGIKVGCPCEILHI